MIDGEVRAAWLSAAILARLAVAHQHAAARAGQPQAARDLDIAHQPDDQRDLEREALCAQALCGCFDQFSLLLEQQHHRAPDGDEL